MRDIWWMATELAKSKRPKHGKRSKPRQFDKAKNEPPKRIAATSSPTREPTASQKPARATITKSDVSELASEASHFVRLLGYPHIATHEQRHGFISSIVQGRCKEPAWRSTIEVLQRYADALKLRLTTRDKQKNGMMRWSLSAEKIAWTERRKKAESDAFLADMEENRWKRSRDELAHVQSAIAEAKAKNTPKTMKPA